MKLGAGASQSMSILGQENPGGRSKPLDCAVCTAVTHPEAHVIHQHQQDESVAFQPGVVVLGCPSPSSTEHPAKSKGSRCTARIELQELCTPCQAPSACTTGAAQPLFCSRGTQADRPGVVATPAARLMLK